MLHQEGLDLILVDALGFVGPLPGDNHQGTGQIGKGRQDPAKVPPFIGRPGANKVPQTIDERDIGTGVVEEDAPPVTAMPAVRSSAKA